MMTKLCVRDVMVMDFYICLLWNQLINHLSCEALRPYETSCITNTNFQDFTTYITQQGYSYDEITISNINYDWWKNMQK